MGYNFYEASVSRTCSREYVVDDDHSADGPLAVVSEQEVAGYGPIVDFKGEVFVGCAALAVDGVHETGGQRHQKPRPPRHVALA